MNEIGVRPEQRENTTEERRENQGKTKGTNMRKQMRRGKLLAVPCLHHLAQMQAQVMVLLTMKGQW